MQPFTFTLDASSSFVDERVARIYRHARVTAHEIRDGQISISGEVPRRLLGRIDPVAR
jgi:hypothetical protein